MCGGRLDFLVSETLTTEDSRVPSEQDTGGSQKSQSFFSPAEISMCDGRLDSPVCEPLTTEDNPVPTKQMSPCREDSNIRMRIRLRPTGSSAVLCLEKTPWPSKKLFLKAKQFRFKYKRSFVVWCPKDQVALDYVITEMSRLGDNFEFNHKWSRLSLCDSQLSWGGGVATFPKHRIARMAAKNLRLRSKTVKIVSFQRIIKRLLNGEGLYPKPNGESTRIVIRAHHTFTQGHYVVLHETLTKFGKLANAHFHDKAPGFGKIFDAEYECQYAAYSASLAMNGMHFLRIGFVDVQVEVTESGKQYALYVMREFMELINRY